MIEPLGEEVRAELRRFGPEGAALDLTAVWPAAVGEEIARNAWPARVRGDGTLVVHVRDAIWGFELTQRAGEIAPRLPGAPPLRFEVGPLPDAAPPDSALDAPASPPEARPTAEEAVRAEGWAAAIADGELREAVARAARASLARAGSRVRDDRPF